MNEITEILFAEINGAKPVEVLRVGTFTDKNGKTVTIDEADLDAYVANFAAGAAGQDVPLDINHERDKAGGWIKRIWREGTKLLAEPEWNQYGQQLVGNKVYRYLSATIDLANKVVRSVSLVNFPAVKGLAPIELSTGDGVFSLSSDQLSTSKQQDNNPQEANMSTNEQPGSAHTHPITTPSTLTFAAPPPDREEIEAEVREQVLAELEAAEAKTAELRETIRTEVEAELAEKFKRRQALTEFASEICSGEAALSTPPDDVVEFLASLDETQLEQAKTILASKIVNLSGGENGSSREGKTEGLLDLPAEVVADLSEGVLTLADMINHNVIDGKVEDYDTSMLTSEQIGV